MRELVYIDVGHYIEARSLGQSYRSYLASPNHGRRSGNADIAELRLVAEARYRLNYNDLVTRKEPLTSEERAQIEQTTFSEIANLRPRTFPQDLRESMQREKRMERKLVKNRRK